MEKNNFKKITINDMPQQLPDDMLETISGGKQNLDANGNFDQDPQHCSQWCYDTYHTCFYMRCPHCHREMFYSMNAYTSDAWWYCFWYNRLWCTSCKNWTEELS